MICKFCSGKCDLLESRSVQGTEFLRKRRYLCIRGHKFNTYEMPEELFKAQKSRLLTRLAQFVRGVELRMEQATRRTLIDRLLDQNEKYDSIALIVRCSKSMVEKRAKERRSVLSENELHPDT